MSPTTPKKLPSASGPPLKKYLDVSVVKKQLFPHQLSPPVYALDHHTAEEIPTSQNYQKREKDLWSLDEIIQNLRLFCIGPSVCVRHRRLSDTTVPL